MQRIPSVDIDEPSTPLLRVIGNNPRMTPLYRQLTTTLVRESQLPQRLRWLVTMRMAWQCKCKYEFGRHATHAATPADVEISSLDIADPRLSEEERLIFNIVDAIYHKQDLSDDIWEKATDYYSIAEILEIITVTGLYFMAASVANVSRLATT